MSESFEKHKVSMAVLLSQNVIPSCEDGKFRAGQHLWHRLIKKMIGTGKIKLKSLNPLGKAWASAIHQTHEPHTASPSWMMAIL